MSECLPWSSETGIIEHWILTNMAAGRPTIGFLLRVNAQKTPCYCQGTLPFTELHLDVSLCVAGDDMLKLLEELAGHAEWENTMSKRRHLLIVIEAENS